MIFSSNLFVYLFLPLIITAYYITPWRFKSYVLLAASYAFYGWWRVEYLVLIFGMSTFSYYMAWLALRGRTIGIRKKALWFAVIIDLGALGYFKYANFFIDNINGILTFANVDALTIGQVLLPIGISFHTFQSISYVIDVYRKDAPPARRLVDFLAFGALFPQLIAGPVLRYKDLADQFITRTHSAENFTAGVFRFMQGLAMKVLIADQLAPLADLIFGAPDPSLFGSWLGAIAYTFQLFFDFAGYSSMAIGLGLMLGFNFVENFKSPYISRSITEFWKRWHISLSTWLRDYLYIPLGGNRLGSRRTYINLVLTMVLGGLWHGSNWTFIIWGFWHGGIMAIERGMGGKYKDTVWPKPLALPITMLFVIVGWVMFRSSTVGAAGEMYLGMIGLNGIQFSPDVLWQIRASQLITLAVAAGICFFPILIRERKPAIRFSALAGLHVALAFAVLTRMASQSYSPFLYFQF